MIQSSSHISIRHCKMEQHLFDESCLLVFRLPSYLFPRHMLRTTLSEYYFLMKMQLCTRGWQSDKEKRGWGGRVSIYPTLQYLEILKYGAKLILLHLLVATDLSLAYHTTPHHSAA